MEIPQINTRRLVGARKTRIQRGSGGYQNGSTNNLDKGEKTVGQVSARVERPKSLPSVRLRLSR